MVLGQARSAGHAECRIAPAPLRNTLVDIPRALSLVLWAGNFPKRLRGERQEA
jgi:hypothetical protein